MSLSSPPIVQYATEAFVREAIAEAVVELLETVATQDAVNLAISGSTARILREFPRVIATAIATEFKGLGFPAEASDAIADQIQARCTRELAPALRNERQNFKSIKKRR